MSLNNYIPVPASFLDASCDETEFNIREEYLTSVVVKYSWGKGRSIRGSEDHPSFSNLRKMLGRTGHIEIEPNWWNGDRTLKRFKLNDYQFEIGDQFSCASAMKYRVRRKKI